MYGELHDLAFLDLYAGSGAVGLEAASRGGRPVVLVERDARAATAVRTNATAIGLADVDVRAVSVQGFLADPAPRAYDVVFLDPPYADSVERDLEVLVGNGWLTTGATVVVERSARSAPPTWPTGLVADRSRRYGDTMLWYGRRP
jgi:16S rRNA (guanine966-N2)-methyltransferase